MGEIASVWKNYFVEQSWKAIPTLYDGRFVYLEQDPCEPMRIRVRNTP